MNWKYVKLTVALVWVLGCTACGGERTLLPGTTKARTAVWAWFAPPSNAKNMRVIYVCPPESHPVDIVSKWPGDKGVRVDLKGNPVTGKIWPWPFDYYYDFDKPMLYEGGNLRNYLKVRPTLVDGKSVPPTQ